MLSSSGFRDALGERDLRFNRESGEVQECLTLRPELAAYELVLRQRVGRLSSLADPRLVAVEALERDSDTHRVAVVSRYASGLRLDYILRTARERENVPDLIVALHLTHELLVAAESFQSLSGLAHGAITPERIVVSADGAVLLADFAFAEVIEAARFSPERLWREFGIASWLGEPFSFAGDVRQCALVGVALVLGRPLDSAAFQRLDPLLQEVEEAAMIRGGRLFADPVIAWFRRATTAGELEGFNAAGDAAVACAELLTERERAAAPAAFLQFLSDLDAPPAEAIPAPGPIAEQSPEPIFAAGEREIGWPTTDFETYQGPGPEFLPVTESSPSDEDTLALPVEDLLPLPDLPPLTFETEPEPVPAAPAADDVPELPARPWAPPATPSFEVTPDNGPRVVSASPFAAAESAARTASAPPVAGDSVVPQFAPATAPPMAPVGSPLPQPDARAVSAQPARPADSPIQLKSASTIKLKHDGPSRRTASTSIRLDLTDRPDPDSAEEDDSSGFSLASIPWKYVAAGLIVLATGIGAATMDWGSSTPAKASSVEKTVEAPPPPPPTTGAIEVLSNTPGSKVLIDGKLRGETPLTVDGLKPGRHTVVVRAPNGNVRRTVKVAVGETTRLDLAVFSGWVVVNAPIELQVLENGKPIGTAGEGPIVLTAGHHTIEVENKTLDYRSSHEVDIQPGEEQRLELNPKGLANFNAVPWAEVWLDGAKIGDTPLGNVPVPLGTREFVFKHPEFGERKVSLTVTGGAPLQVSVDFSK